MTDHEIVELYWNRNQEAIKQTQYKFEAYLRKIANNVLANFEDSKEVVNDTYLAAWNSMPDNKPKILSTYLGKITRQISIDMYRRKHAVKRNASEYALSLDELGECVSGGSSPEQEFEAERLNSTIKTFLGTLSEDERNTFIGRYYFFDPLKTVAKYCGMSEAKAKSMLYRTRQKLKEYLVKEGFDL